jgi:hypothetical protein
MHVLAYFTLVGCLCGALLSACIALALGPFFPLLIPHGQGRIDGGWVFGFVLSLLFSGWLCALFGIEIDLKIFKAFLDFRPMLA